MGADDRDIYSVEPGLFRPRTIRVVQFGFKFPLSIFRAEWGCHHGSVLS